MFLYQPIEEQLYTSDLGMYRSYGICIKDDAGNIVSILSDVSTNKELVTDLATRCTSGELAPEHLRDVVLNSI